MLGLSRLKKILRLNFPKLEIALYWSYLNSIARYNSPLKFQNLALLVERRTNGGPAQAWTRCLRFIIHKCAFFSRKKQCFSKGCNLRTWINLIFPSLLTFSFFFIPYVNLNDLFRLWVPFLNFNSYIDTCLNSINLFHFMRVEIQ